MESPIVVIASKPLTTVVVCRRATPNSEIRCSGSARSILPCFELVSHCFRLGMWRARLAVEREVQTAQKKEKRDCSRRARVASNAGKLNFILTPTTRPTFDALDLCEDTFSLTCWYRRLHKITIATSHQAQSPGMDGISQHDERARLTLQPQALPPFSYMRSKNRHARPPSASGTIIALRYSTTLPAGTQPQAPSTHQKKTSTGALAVMCLASPFYAVTPASDLTFPPFDPARRNAQEAGGRLIPVPETVRLIVKYRFISFPHLDVSSFLISHLPFPQARPPRHSFLVNNSHRRRSFTLESYQSYSNARLFPSLRKAELHPLCP